MKKICLLGLLLLFICAFTACGKSDKIKIKVAEVAHSVFYAPQYVALEKGFFASEGLDVTLINANGADKVMAALLSKDVQIGLMGAEASIYVYAEGQENYAINFAQLTKKDGSFIVAREKIDDFDFTMMKGKAILGGRKGGMPEMTLEYVLKKAGLDVGQDDASKDVNVRTDVQFAALSGAFVSGEADYVSLFEPNATALDEYASAYGDRGLSAVQRQLQARPVRCLGVGDAGTEPHCVPPADTGRSTGAGSWAPYRHGAGDYHGHAPCGGAEPL